MTLKIHQLELNKWYYISHPEHRIENDIYFLPRYKNKNGFDGYSILPVVGKEDDKRAIVEDCYSLRITDHECKQVTDKSFLMILDALADCYNRQLRIEGRRDD